MWKCKKCNEENEDSFDICWKCGYGINGETPDEIESEVEIIKKDTKERIKAEDAKYKKKKRIIIFLIFLPIILGMINYFIEKPNNTHKIIPSVKSSLYNTKE